MFFISLKSAAGLIINQFGKHFIMEKYNFVNLFLFRILQNPYIYIDSLLKLINLKIGRLPYFFKGDNVDFMFSKEKRV